MSLARHLILNENDNQIFRFLQALSFTMTVGVCVTTLLTGTYTVVQYVL